MAPAQRSLSSARPLSDTISDRGTTSAAPEIETHSWSPTNATLTASLAATSRTEEVSRLVKKLRSSPGATSTTVIGRLTSLPVASRVLSMPTRVRFTNSTMCWMSSWWVLMWSD